MGSLITRTFTDSYFDHVAMVLNFNEEDDIFFVEATGNMGVSLNRWLFLKDHVGPGKFYEQVAVRHVNFKRDARTFKRLEQFLQEAVGLQYAIDGGKLMRQKTTKVQDSKRLVEEDRTFFCSELLAKAFKILGVIEDDDTSCTQFYPHHFSSRGDSFLKLTKGTTIENE